MYHVSDMFMDYLIQPSQQPYAVDIISPFADEENRRRGWELAQNHPASPLQNRTITQFLSDFHLLLHPHHYLNLVEKIKLSGF